MYELYLFTCIGEEADLAFLLFFFLAIINWKDLNGKPQKFSFLYFESFTSQKASESSFIVDLFNGRIMKVS